MSSRFFAVSDSDSDSSSSSSSSNSSNSHPPSAHSPSSSDEEEEEDEQQQTKTKQKPQTLQQKRKTEVANTLTTVENALKINDFIPILPAIETLFKNALTHASLRTLKNVERGTEMEKEKVKKMNANNARALNACKQKMRKWMKENVKVVEELEKTVEVPEEEEEQSDEETKEAAPAPKKAKKAVKGAQFFKKEVESASGSDADSDGDSDSDGSVKPTKTSKKASKWIKDGSSSESEVDDKTKKRKPNERKVRNFEKEDFSHSGFTQIGKGGKPKEFTTETLYTRLKEILDARGKKATNRSTQIENLQKLLEVAATSTQKVKVLVALLSARFDQNSSLTSHMPIETWTKAAAEVQSLTSLLQAHRDITLTEGVDVNGEEVQVYTPSDNKDDDSQKDLRGSLVSYLERLDSEFSKSLQNMDQHTVEYMDRMRDEQVLYKHIVAAQKYLQSVNNIPSTCRLVMLRMEHLYFKPSKIIQILEEGTQSSTEVLQDLANYIYINGKDRLKTRAMLCVIYHLALNENYYEARDLLLMSHLQETIQLTDIPTQVLYNRAMVQIGMCAFKCGLTKEAENCLHDIMQTSRVKELLAQGVQMQRFGERSVEQETIERSRMLPYYMHINLELLECIYLVASMLLEIPSMAANAHEARKVIISRPFRRLLDFSLKQPFNGPPENVRDHIMGASKKLLKGDWKAATTLINAIPIWDLLPNPSKVKEMLATKIQQEGLRTFLFTYANFYESVGLSDLAALFDMSRDKVYTIVAKMIVEGSLHAFLNKENDTLVISKAEPSRLQVLCLQLADKANMLVESNEKQSEHRMIRDNRTGKDNKNNRGGFRRGGGRGRGGYSHNNQERRSSNPHNNHQ